MLGIYVGFAARDAVQEIPYLQGIVSEIAKEERQKEREREREKALCTFDKLSTTVSIKDDGMYCVHYD